MIKFTISWVSAVVVLASIISCNLSSDQSSTIKVDKEQIKKDIQAREDEFAQVYNSGKIVSIGYYADDAITFYQNRSPLVGKEAIVDFLKTDLDSNSNIISFKTKEVFPSNDGNQVVEIGYFELMDSSNTIVNTGNYMVLFEKRNGQYVCVRDMSVSNVPNQ